MNLPWATLCDAYLLAIRRLVTNLAQLRVSEGKISAHEANSLLESPEQFHVCLDMIRMGSFATVAELDEYRQASPTTLAELEGFLAHPERRHFVKALAWDANYVPPALIFSFTRGAVYTTCPSCNRIWIELAVRVDPAAVEDALLWFLEEGTEFEAGGAANASYWFDADWSQLDRYRRACLKRFVETEDVHLRRCLVSRISWEPGDYPADLHSMLQEATALASQHPDEYVASRYLCDTGRSDRIPCLPHRPSEG